MPRTKAPRESWVDWQPEGLPEPPLLSHGELLEHLEGRGVEVSPSTLEHYRRTGVIPRPVRRMHEGAVRPVYPSWLVDAIVHLRELQSKGMSLEDIAPIMRAWPLSVVQWQDPLAGPLTAARAALLDVARVLGHDVASINFAFLDDNDQEIFQHTLAVPGEWRRR